MSVSGRWSHLLRDLAHAPTSKAVHFELLHQSTRSAARTGILHTPHGSIPTPSFVPVATSASLKCVDLASLHLPNPHLTFCNTFHLLCSPTGPHVIERLGGLHRFMALPPGSGGLITDSGGFQVFSLANHPSSSSSDSIDSTFSSTLNSTAVSSSSSSSQDMLKGQRGSRSPYRPGALLLKVTDEGALFRSPLNGDVILLSPELSVQTQKQLGADIIVVMDELPPLQTGAEALLASLNRTHEWELRSLASHLEDPRGQAIYGIVHGGTDPQLRKLSAEFVSALPFDGLAVGGSIGGTKGEMLHLLGTLMPAIRASPAASRPRHLLGIGDPYSLARAVSHGLDTFDSVFPTRAARHGTVYRHAPGHHPPALESISLRKIDHADVLEPLDPTCECPVCAVHSTAYLHHLLRSREPLFGALATTHNLFVWDRFMSDIRQLIEKDLI